MPGSSLISKISRNLKPAIVIFGVAFVSHLLSSMVFDSGWSVALFTALLVALAFVLLLSMRPALFDRDGGAKQTSSASQSLETDSGTGVLSLRSLTISLLESMALAERYSRSLSMVQIIIDDFDGVQSRFGTAAVDAAAAVLGNNILNAVRMPDRVGRYSPNSFILVLPETDAIGARQFSERIRRLVVDEEIRARQGQRFSISVSAGVATFESGDDPQRLIDRAENAVQEAQSLGGNRTVVYSADL